MGKTGLRAGLAALALVLAGNVAASADDWDQVVAAAKKEGSVAVYTADVGSVCGPARLKAFQDKFGIKVDTLAARGTEVDQRVETEQAAGRFIGDVYSNGYATAIIHEGMGSFQRHGDLPNLAQLLPDYKDDGTIIPSQDLLYGMLVNSNLVQPADMPRSWKDLADPKWKGKILADDFRVLGNGNIYFEATSKLYGDAYSAAMAAQDIVFDRDPGADGRRVASGEFLIYMPLMASYFPRLAGLPLAFQFPEDGSPENIGGLAMLRGAPHPNAARLLMNYYLDPDWGVTCANEGRKSVTRLPEDKLGPFARQLLRVKLLGPSDYAADKQAFWIAKAKQFFK